MIPSGMPVESRKSILPINKTTLPKSFLFILTFLIVISLANSSSLIITPSSTNITTFVNQNSTLTFNILNNLTFNIYNVTLVGDNYFSSSVIPELDIGQNNNLNVYLYTTNQFTQNANPKIQFLFLTTSTSTPQTYTISISNTSFNPNSITIKKGDTINFNNVDSVLHRVYSTSFDSGDIASGSSYSRQFNDIGTIPYTESNIGFGGTIIVNTNQLQTPTHDSNYDVTIPIAVTSNFISTTLTMNLIDNNLTIPYNSVNEGIFQISSGSTPAQNITFSSSSKWVSFNINSIPSLSANTNKAIIFKVIPSINSNSQTGQTYSLPITVSGSNFNSITQNVQVYIPTTSDNITSSNISSEQLREQLASVLKNYLDLLNSQNTTCINSDTALANITANLSGSNVLQALLNFNDIKNDTSVTNAYLKQIVDYYVNQNLNITNDTATRLAMLENITLENQKKVKDDETRNNILVIFLIILIIVSIAVMIILMNKNKKIRDDKEMY